MGPFKHTVDDGLDLRKAAFECMYTLLDSCLDRLDIFTFLNHVEDGLKDHYDIKVHKILRVHDKYNYCHTRVEKVLILIKGRIVVKLLSLNCFYLLKRCSVYCHIKHRKYSLLYYLY